MKNCAVVLLGMVLVMGLVVCVNAEDRGAATIFFEKGRMPEVTFPHRLHQEVLDNDCSACHDLFPMQAGIIREMIAKDELKRQQVMNTKCLACHKERLKAGEPAGPTKCTQCHVRPK